MDFSAKTTERPALVVDFHAHAFPDRMAEGVMANMARKAGIPSYADGTVEGLKAAMARAGVDLALLSRITEKPGSVSSVNRWLKSVEGGPLRVAGTLHPEDPDIIGEIGRLKRHGFTGVKIHPDYQRFCPEERRLYPVYEELRAQGMWVLLHAGLDRGLPGSDPACRPKGLRAILDGFPGLRVIAAHLGGEEIYDEAEEYLVGREIFLDTSFILRKMPEETFRRIVSRHGACRILWGSDTPWTDQGADIDFVMTRSYLSDSEKEGILGANALRLLGGL